MENITSRKNEYIRRLRLLASDAAYRQEHGEFVCQGMKMLREALAFGAKVTSVLWKGTPQVLNGLEAAEQFCAAEELFDYACFAKNSAGPLFTVRIERAYGREDLHNAVILESVQDPGNVGTVIRTASAMGIGAVILTGSCADLYNPKTVSATMGAIFRQRVLNITLEELRALPLEMYGAALSDKARDIREVKLAHAAVVIGSEGSGISRRLLEACAGEIIIPMQPCSESLNAAVAAAIAMWEMTR